jgi:hypothetical protein
MKAKLVKKQEGWYNLYQNDIGIGSTHTELQGYKLSLANCQAIERGYDLDQEMCKLVDKKAEQNNTVDLNAYAQGCLDAFQKALELMGDKKFSEDDMKAAYGKGFLKQSIKSFNSLIQSLQQTEWDVEIVMSKQEYTWTPPGEGFEDQAYRDWREVPKLDADGCLILKI